MNWLFWISLTITAGITIWKHLLLQSEERLKLSHKIILFLSILGLIISGYSYYQHNIENLREKAEFKYGEISEQQLYGRYQITIDLIPV